MSSSIGQNPTFSCQQLVMNIMSWTIEIWFRWLGDNPLNLPIDRWIAYCCIIGLILDDVIGGMHWGIDELVDLAWGREVHLVLDLNEQPVGENDVDG
jgi:hypothetical protein